MGQTLRFVDADVLQLVTVHPVLPLTLPPPTIDAVRYAAWKRGYSRHFRADEAKLDLLDNFYTQVWQRFIQYRVPVIELTKETPKEAVCQVFAFDQV